MNEYVEVDEITIRGLYLDNEGDVWIRDWDKLTLLTVAEERAKKEDRRAFRARDYSFKLILDFSKVG